MPFSEVPVLGELALEVLGLRLRRHEAMALVHRLALLAQHRAVMTRQEADRARRAADMDRRR